MPGKKLLKKILLNIGYHCRIFDLIRIAYARNGYVPILLYHHILEDAETTTGKSCFYLRGIGISQAQFSQEMRYVARNYNVITLKEYIEKKNKGEVPYGALVITFDDGFKDASLRILREYRLSATFFIIASTFKELYWRHALYLLLDHAEKSSFTDKVQALSALLGSLEKASPEARRAMIAELKLKLGVGELTPQDVYFSENDIRTLSKEAVSFGAHSFTHADLTGLDEAAITKEIEGALGVIQALTKEDRIAFSLPLGRYDEKILAVLKNKNVLCGLTSDNGLNAPDEDIYRLKRINVYPQALAEFVYNISGIESLFRRAADFILTQADKHWRFIRRLIVLWIKKFDRLTRYKLGDILRRITDVNKSRYWDNYFSQFTNNFYRDFPYRFLMEFLPQGGVFSLLDIGCGLGDGCALIKKHFPAAEIEGADFSPIAISKARKKNIISYYLLDIKNAAPHKKYDFISLVHILEHFNDPFIVLDKCLNYVNKAVFVITPYEEKIDYPRLYSKGEHRYLFNENTFHNYKCRVLKITELIPATGYRYIIYKIEP